MSERFNVLSIRFRPMGRKPGARTKADRAATIGATLIAELIAALRALGYEEKGRARKRDSRALPDHFAPRVPAATAIDLFSEAERATRDRLVGLHAGERTEPQGVMVHLVISSASLRDALDHYVHFGPLLIDTLRIRLERRDSTAAIAFDFGDPRINASHHVASYVLIATARVLRAAIGPSLSLHHVRFRHDDEPDEKTEARRAFDCAVHFGRADDALVFRAEDLDVAPRVANPLVAEQIRKFAAALAARATPAAAVRDRVADAVREALASGARAERRATARRLGGDATLIRRLAEEGTSFRKVRDAVLWETVDALLSNPSLKIEAIAWSVGFADGAAFAKAMKRRTGCSPSVHRARLARRLRPAKRPAHGENR